MVGHGELHSDEVRPWRRLWKNGQWPSPTARLAQLEGQRGRGGHGGACSAAMVGRCYASAAVGSEGRARNGNVSWEAHGRTLRLVLACSGPTWPE